jgi:hypothetical protein
MPSSGRASPSLRWAWTKKQRKHKLKPVLGLTPNVVQKVEPGQGLRIEIDRSYRRGTTGENDCRKWK